jgi:hypothetical protein
MPQFFQYFLAEILSLVHNDYEVFIDFAFSIRSMVVTDIPALPANSALLIKSFSRSLFMEFIFILKLRVSKKEKPLPFPKKGGYSKTSNPCAKSLGGAWLTGLARGKMNPKSLS